MLFTNPTDYTIKLDSLGLDPVPPKSDVEIPLSLAAPYRHDNGSRGKSAVESVAPQLVPKDPQDLAAWNKIPEMLKQESRIVTVAARPAAEAPGVKALLAAKANASQNATAKPTANVSPQAGK